MTDDTCTCTECQEIDAFVFGLLLRNPATDVTRGAGEANEGEVAPGGAGAKQGPQNGVQP